MTTEAWNWLEQVRGLDTDLCERMGVRPGNHKHLGPGVAFPYRRGGSLTAEKFRPLAEKTFRWFPTGAPHGMFNHDVLVDETLSGQPIIITEGEIDCLSVIQAGFPRTVSVPDGWTDKADLADGAKMKPLLEVEKLLADAPCVIVAADADATGDAFTRAIAALLDPQVVKHATWPEGCKDPNDVLRKHGEGELARCINAARQANSPGGMITGFSDMPPQSERRIFRMGFAPFDGGLAFEEGAMSVCTGRPGFGKSTFVRFAAHHLINNETIRVGVLDLENSAIAMRDHLVRLNTGSPWAELGKHQRDDAMARLDRNWRVAHRPPNGDFAENMDWLEKRIKHMAVRERCKFIPVDPWNELEHVLVPGETMTNYINWALKSIRQWAERFDTHICVVAHPKKMPIPTHVPDGYDVADSAAFFNKPSLGFTVHQADGDDPHVRIDTWKVRDIQRYRFGRGTMRCQFDPQKMVYRGRL